MCSYCGYITMGTSLWLCLYWVCVGVYGYQCQEFCCEKPHVCAEWARWFGMLLDLVQVDEGLDLQIAENVVSLAIVCQFLCIVAVNSLTVSDKGITMGRMLILVSFFLLLEQQVIAVKGENAFVFLMMRRNGYAQASRKCVRLLSSDCSICSSRMITLYRRACE